MHSQLSELLAVAAVARGRGNLQQALQHLKAAEGIAPLDPKVLNSLGMVFLELNKLSEAERCFERAIAEDAIAPELWMNLAKVHRLTGNDLA